MAKNIGQIPYTELVERTKSLGRVSENESEKIRGVVQDTYVREISSKFDWEFLITSSSLTTIAEYKEGTVTLNTGDTTAVFSSAASFDGTFTGRKIKFSSNDAVYDVTYLNATGLTIKPALRGSANISAGSYSVFQPSYALAGDFDRFPKDGGLFRWTGGKSEILPELDSYKQYRSDYQASPTLPRNIRLAGTDTAGNQLLEFVPAPNTALNYGYDYLRRLAPLTETTTGLISSIAAEGTIVSGMTSARFLEATTGDWFRVDALGKGQDSQWYRIISIAHDSSLTLNTVFANTAITSSANYTISKAPEMPVRLHPAILWGTLRAITVDQTDQNALFYNQRFAEVMSDGKRLYVTRVYSKDIHHLGEDYLYRR